MGKLIVDRGHGASVRGKAARPEERLAEAKKLLFQRGLANAVARRGTKSEQHFILSLIVALKVANKIQIGPRHLSRLHDLEKKYL